MPDDRHAGAYSNCSANTSPDPSTKEPPRPLQVAIRSTVFDTPKLEQRLASSPSEAARAIGVLARNGSTVAQLVYGQLLLDGRGLKPDPTAAYGWFARAADAGDTEARNMVGRCHERGWGVTQDYRRAAQHFASAARQGHVWAKVNLAQILTRLGDPADRPRAFALFREAADTGNLKAINSLARFLEEGWGTARDPIAASRLYRIAAERGDHWAKVNLATLLLARGEQEEACALISQAIRSSDAGFCRRVGPLLLARPDPSLRRLALDALAKAANAGTPDDAYRYALALDLGAAASADRAAARRWFRRAADQGHEEARACCRHARAGHFKSALSCFAGRCRPGPDAPLLLEPLG